MRAPIVAMTSPGLDPLADAARRPEDPGGRGVHEAIARVPEDRPRLAGQGPRGASRQDGTQVIPPGGLDRHVHAVARDEVRPQPDRERHPSSLRLRGGALPHPGIDEDVGLDPTQHVGKGRERERDPVR